MYDDTGPRPLPDGTPRHRHKYRCECGAYPAHGTVRITGAIVWVLALTLLFVVMASAWWVVRTVGGWAF